MSSGGGSTTTQTLPSWLEDAAKQNLARANYTAQLGYVPYYGNDVAAFSPMQQSSMQNTADAASAFGLSAPSNAMAGMPQATTDANGFTGYSSGNLFDSALSELQQRRPAQYNAVNSMFIDPNTGTAPVVFTPSGPVTTDQAGAAIQNQVMSSGGYVMPTANIYDPTLGTAENPYTDYKTQGWIDPSSTQGLLLNLLPFGTIGMGINNANAVGKMQDMAGIDRSGFFDRATLDPRETIGNTNIGGTDYMINMGGGVYNGVTGLTPYEASRRNQMLGYDTSYITDGGVAPQVGLPADISVGSDGKYVVDNVGAYDTLDEAVTASVINSTPTNTSGTTTSTSDGGWTTNFDDGGSLTQQAPAVAPSTPSTSADRRGTSSSPSSGGGTVQSATGGSVTDRNGNPISTGSSSSSSSSSSAGSSGGGTYCCTAMRKNGDWTSPKRLYRMHKWHYDQPQWWRDGYDVWGKILADNLLKEKGSVWSKIMNAFYEHRVAKKPATVKSVIADVMVYPAVFAIGMAKKLTGKHIELVEVGE